MSRTFFFSDEVNEDDELAWDNYGESDLGTWSPQVTAGASSLDGGHSDAELYKDLSEDEKKPAAISVVKEVMLFNTECDFECVWFCHMSWWEDS